VSRLEKSRQLLVVVNLSFFASFILFINNFGYGVTSCRIPHCRSLIIKIHVPPVVVVGVIPPPLTRRQSFCILRSEKGGGNRKIGNAYLKWAFSEAAILLIRESNDIKAYHQKLKNKHGKAKAIAILSHRIGRAAYYILKNKQAFDMKRFL